MLANSRLLIPVQGAARLRPGPGSPPLTRDMEAAVFIKNSARNRRRSRWPGWRRLRPTRSSAGLSRSARLLFFFRGGFIKLRTTPIVVDPSRPGALPPWRALRSRVDVRRRLVQCAGEEVKARKTSGRVRNNAPPVPQVVEKRLDRGAQSVLLFQLLDSSFPVLPTIVCDKHLSLLWNFKFICAIHHQM
jgi:hypothetical protein